MNADASQLCEFDSPAADPNAPGFPTTVDVIVIDERVFVRFSQQSESRRGTDTVVITQAKFLELADTMRNLH